MNSRGGDRPGASMCQRTGRTRSGNPRAANDKRRSIMMTDQMPDMGALVRPGAALREFRAERGLTLAELSQRTGLPVSSLSKIENDKVELTIDKLLRISLALDVRSEEHTSELQSL